MFGRVSRRPVCRALEPVVHVPRRERLLFFFFGDSTTRTRHIPNVLRIHVRVINSTPLALRCLPVFLSPFSRGPTFSNIPNCTDSIWGPSEASPTSLFSLSLSFISVLLRQVFCIDRRVYMSFFLRFRVALRRAAGWRILRRCDDNK